MVHIDEVSRQLKELGASFRFWCRAEIKELPKILFENETIKHLVIVRYEGGFALLCATDYRVLLVDKKPFYLTLEDIRYDMVSDVQYNHRLIDASIMLGTMHKTIRVIGYNHHKLRDLTGYIQEQVLRHRQQQVVSQQPQFQQAVEPATPIVTQPLVPVQQSTGMSQAVDINPVQAMLSVPRRVVNPYNMPVIIRRRVSRFY